jgi:hypothetical protein
MIIILSNLVIFSALSEDDVDDLNVSNGEINDGDNVDDLNYYNMDETNSLGDYENNLSFENQQVDVNCVQNDLIAQMNQLSLNGDVDTWSMQKSIQGRIVISLIF